MKLNKQKAIFIVTAIMMFSLLVGPANSQTNRIILDNNIGVTSSVWEIQGEPTLVMNGFDITPTPLQLPVVLENINIDIFQGVPNELVDVVVYEDPNGGSPSDARLVASTQVAIAQEGVFAVQFPSPVVINSPVVWIGFYMPPGMKFRADRQGSSVLTYWAWTPGALFDLRNLSSAQILGPSDGSDPVNINLQGIARIRAEAITANLTVNIDPFETTVRENVDPEGVQYLINHAGCPTLFFDQADIGVSYNNSISITCREVESWNAPRSPVGFTRRSNSRNVVYDITFFDSDGKVLTNELPIAVSHCVAPASNELSTAVLGVAYGAPRRWELLPSEAISNLLCAEVRHGGSISYFTPDGG